MSVQPVLRALPALLLGCAFVSTAHAQAAASANAANNAQAQPAAAAAASSTTVTWSLRQLGAQYALNLRGVDGSNTLPVGVRDDQVVSGARLNLRYAYSPALLPDLSHINVLVNDQVAASIAVPKEAAGASLQRTIALPAYLFTSNSKLRLQLIGHYTTQCEDPLHSSLWANISNESTLSIDTQPLPQANDLARLPKPFFDGQDIRRLSLPVVFPGNPDTAALEAAGAVSSWFGALASFRGADFPVSLSAVPAQGNAVVIVEGAQQAALAGAPLQGPTLAIVSNPNDPNGKLLLVMGRDGKELKQAADALVTGSQTLAGPSALITHFADLAPRKPYDAPRWLRTDRPVSFGELIDTKQLSVSGYSPDLIRINTRVPPDLFGWHAQNVPIDLHYRYTPQPYMVNSSLLFSVSDQFMKSIPLLPLERLEGGDKLRAEVLPDSSLPRQAKLEVPLESLLQPNTQLQFRYMYDYIKQGECRDIIIDNVRGAIDPESTIDLSRYPHYIAMPNLAAFAQAGFPFTRMADLSDTDVVLGANAGPQEYSTYLAVMGRMGDSTGYPARGVTVLRGQRIDAMPAAKDLLVIASGADQAWLKDWAGYMPAAYDHGAQFSLSDLPGRVRGWFHANPRLDAAPGRLSLAWTGPGVSAVLAGFESPKEKGRSVVMLVSNQSDGLKDAVAALLGVPNYDKQPIQGSLVSIRGNEVDALVGEHTYYVGHLGLWRGLDWWLASFGLSLASLLKALGVVVLALLAAGGFVALRRRQARRDAEAEARLRAKQHAQ
ncbi:cellulose biosynthesis cyclic di-GMP-binding regulatory protein BcsB [Paraburkholderia sp. CNPSo 3272]|uniref:cellulose biosynthesis cyclic di-GMP-binding regulatory protein BcsB n=1 Tax=Paraburkholderia sp. CNPSo 3272 TaxID=2940931 RepID=UPI0020B87C15|nr:cellulose biosynthesis cyclic di-GMP-binding regulatory protein BcsB [Paraburkholderia sp. CNPSo 3272]MCP3724114.1 cellulose biosynthesis cyclic di-GMP-binding regulatory protein BcsB [Paraburkholderia sp. CNPSo 3272]